jgi:hypothetical protein
MDAEQAYNEDNVIVGQVSLDRTSFDPNLNYEAKSKQSIDCFVSSKTSGLVKSPSITANRSRRMKRIINASRLQQIGEPGFDVVSLGGSS